VRSPVGKSRDFASLGQSKATNKDPNKQTAPTRRRPRRTPWGWLWFGRQQVRVPFGTMLGASPALPSGPPPLRRPQGSRPGVVLVQKRYHLLQHPTPKCEVADAGSEIQNPPRYFHPRRVAPSNFLGPGWRAAPRAPRRCLGWGAGGRAMPRAIATARPRAARPPAATAGRPSRGRTRRRRGRQTGPDRGRPACGEATPPVGRRQQLELGR
jgi:hypothetical protein